MKTRNALDWISTREELPPEGARVLTKIDDEKGCRNEQVLVRHGNLWFTGTDANAMYVYYRPTHWRALGS
jgi:hypothetical protein